MLVQNSCQRRSFKTAGLEKVPGIFISRLVPGGLAELTGLLAVNDEVLEVNGIEVAGKTLDQVTDMMIANSSNLIVTVKPANQRTVLGTANHRSGGGGTKRRGSQASAASDNSDSEDKEEQDDVIDVTRAEGEFTTTTEDEAVLRL